MRNSQITLLGAIGAILLVVVVVAAGARLALSSFASEADRTSARTGETSPDTTTSLEDLTGFDGILIRGNWEVNTVRGDDWRVELSVPEGRQEDLRVLVQDGRLVLNSVRRNNGWWNWWGSSNEQYRADIVVPDLRSIEVQGSTSVDFRDFDGDELTVTSSGAVNIQGSDSRFEQLSLIISGAGNVDFKDVPVVNANVELSGASNVMLAMDGGRLTGTLSGFGNVSYSGSVSVEDVDVSGFGRVGN